MALDFWFLSCVCISTLDVRLTLLLDISRLPFSGLLAHFQFFASYSLSVSSEISPQCTMWDTFFRVMGNSTM